MNLELTDKEFRRLLDLVYVGNWVMNSMRGENRIQAYDDVESKCFSYCLKTGMYSLFEMVDGEVVPSAGFEEGGIQEAIMDYEDGIFYDILAEQDMPFRDWRRARGLSQKQAAAALGIPEGTAKAYDWGREIPEEIRERMAKYQ